MNDLSDVIIVGGGPTGMSAALILGRCLRTVLLFDNGKPRNSYSHALHGYLTQDGLCPKDFLAKARDELKPYKTVSHICGEVAHTVKTPRGFKVTLVTGEVYESKKLLVATGVMDDIPDFEGILDFYGTSVHICPYCDAFELTDQAVAVFGKGERGYKQAISLHQWTDDLVLLTDGPAELSPDQHRQIEARKIVLNEKKIKALSGKDGKLESILFEDGTHINRVAMFFNTRSLIRSKILEQLECDFAQDSGVVTGKYESTNIHGLFVAGNICREVQLVIVAAGEGAEAAFGINTSLNNELHDQYLQGKT